ncbi:MAG: helix-turn-helix transcriptional regulator [Clostridia bacterium]|nr:helix-turn-helix transcriptional regulator [Clostridia bacterium]
MEAAGVLLRKNKESVSVIAARCGYNDANYFSRLFKNMYGVTPVQWRKAK